MFRRASAAVTVTALLATGFTATAATATAAPTGATWITAAPKSVTEGARIAVRVRVAHPRRATTVRLQEWQQDIYGASSWVTVRSRPVKGTSRHVFKVVATAKNFEKYRSQVSYRGGGTAASRARRVTVWRWISLMAYQPYYQTNGVILTPYLSFSINGNEYLGWRADGSASSWESRYTPGRHCKAFRGVLGVTDSSADGSTATIRFGTPAHSAIYTSPTLSPGMQTKINIALNRPYRFLIHADNTSPSGTGVYPAIGDPALLCTGVD